MKKIFFTPILFVAAGVFVIPGLNSPANAQAKKSASVKETKTERMLKDIGASYQPFQGEGTFIVVYAGKEKKDLDVIIIDAGTVVVTLVDIAAGGKVDLTPELMRKLLEFNMNVDYIKVGISNLGSVRVQSEQNLAAINAKAFQVILDQTAAGGDDVAKIIKPFLKRE